MLDSEEIRSVLPHRYPMLLVDRILEMTPAKHAVGLKTVTADEAMVMGPGGRSHFPNTLIIEAMAQVGGFPMGALGTEAALMVSLEQFEFDGFAYPGDIIRIESTVLWDRGKMFKVDVEACTSSGFQARGSVMFARQSFEKQLDPVKR
jgi:3-hydroxymyristoyl/3-hydroxydecanoyl-(acyl carrier protein) dehydratase